MAHSDRGSQYASEHYQRRLAEERIACSMSRRGNCWDNAPMESFFASLKKELVHDEDYATRDAGEGEHLRVHRGVLQPRPPALVAGVRRPGRVRADAQPNPPLNAVHYSWGTPRPELVGDDGTDALRRSKVTSTSPARLAIGGRFKWATGDLGIISVRTACRYARMTSAMNAERVESFHLGLWLGNG